MPSSAPVLKVVREHCDRCGQSSRSNEDFGGSTLCATCFNEVRYFPLTVFHVELLRWAYKPLDAQRVFRVTHAS